MTTTLIFPGPIDAEVQEAAKRPIESAGVLLVRRVEQGKDIRLLARNLCWVSDDAYRRRTATRMTIIPEGYVGALAEAERDGSIPLWFHTHPGKAGVPLQSEWDVEVDAAIADLFRIRSGSTYYGTLIASPRETGFAFSGSLVDEAGVITPIDRLWSVGDRWQLTLAYGADSPDVDGIFDRNVRAFGPAIQNMLRMLRVAIVGAGGTGSAVAEQLVRLGIRDMILVDADSLTASNVTRVYGSTAADAGRLKVHVLGEYLLRIAPDLECRTVAAMATLQSTADVLSGVDLIFGCTDDNAGRLVLSRLSTYFLTPVIDVGVLLSSGPNGLLQGIDGRVTVLAPGQACLACRDRVDMGRAMAELKTPEERRRLADEGYAPALGEVEPAVVAFTTAVAAAAVGELLERLIGYGPSDRPSEILLRLHEREISTNQAEPRPAHYCHPSQGKWGAGDEEPFLGQLWPEQ